MKQYSFVQEAYKIPKFETGTLSAQINNHFKNMRQFTKISPQKFDEAQYLARKGAANSIKQFKDPVLRKREHRRQLRRFERLMNSWNKKHK